MQAIVDAAPDAPDIDTATAPGTSRRSSPVLVMAGAFAVVLLVGAVTSLLVLGNDRGTAPSGGAGDGVATLTSVAVAPPIAYGALPPSWDAVAIIDAGAPAQDRTGIVRAVGQAGRIFGVESVAIVSPDDVATALGWDDGLGGGIFIVTSGNAQAAEQAALQAQSVWREGIVQIVFSAERRKQAMEAATQALTLYAERVTDELSLGMYSGPEPAFDTAELGIEMPLENAYDGADGLPVVLDVVGRSSDSVVYIGSIDGINGFVYGVDTDGGTTEICQAAVWAMADAVMTACFDGSETGLSKSLGMADSATDGITINVTALDDEVSAVGIELPSGQRYWQRPIAGSSMFVTTDPDALAGITITLYGESGNPLTTDQFNPNP